jgi:hypothetical protein
MSFGFSVNDIISASHEAYRLYGRLKNAGSEFAEISDTVAGLHGILNYLSQHADRVGSAHLKDKDATDIHQRLNAVVVKCASTLEDVQKFLNKYKDYLLDPTTKASLPQGKMGTLRTVFTRNVKRLTWAGKGDELNEFREIMQKHIVTITTILSASAWYVSFN